MKKGIMLICVLLCALGITGCDNNTTAQNDTVSTDYGKVIEFAKAEFSEMFKEFENIQIEETLTNSKI